MTSLPKPLSAGEETFALHVRQARLKKPEREYRFDGRRKWRFDFAWPAVIAADVAVAVEIEGGSWSGGRHTRGKGFAEDCEKYSTASLLGWKVGRFTTEQVERGEAIEWTKKALA